LKSEEVRGYEFPEELKKIIEIKEILYILNSR
jgi:hypothetical protein